MTATIPAQTMTTATDDLQIMQTPPTMADAQLIVQINIADTLSEAHLGFGVLRAFDNPPTLGQLKKKHPQGSKEWNQVAAFLMSGETTATFVKNGVLNEALVNDLYWLAGGWQASEKVIKGIRKEAGEPRLYENIEWLAKRAT